MAEIRHINQYLKKRGNRWHYRRLVPRAYGLIDKRGEIRSSLKTSSLEVARSRRDALAEADDLYWASLDVAENSEIDLTVSRYVAAKKRAMGRGYMYTSVKELAETGDITDILSRLKEVTKHPKEEKQEAVALLGTAKPSSVKISAAFDIYCDQISVADLIGKSPIQKKSWKKVKNRAVQNFIKLCGDLRMDEIDRTHAREFFNWWTSRVVPKDGSKALNPNSANRDIGNLQNLYRRYWEFEGDESRDNPFRKLRFAKPKYKEILAFDDKFVQTVIMAPDTFDGINEEAKLVVYAMIETGCRPSEIVGLKSEHIILDHAVPHIRIRPGDNRALKTPSSQRDIPLLGISLHAFTECPNGFDRYRNKSNSLSAFLMKTFRTRNLFPTESHRVYSFRHSFEKRMLEANIDYGLRCTLMGHHNPRPAYGDGGSLEYRRDELTKITHPYK